MTTTAHPDPTSHLRPEDALDLAHALHLGPDAVGERARLLAHARSCATCGTALAAVEAEGRLLRERLAQAPGPVGLEGRIVDEVRSVARARARARRALLVVVAVTGVVAAATGAAFGLRAPRRHELLVRAIETSEARALSALLEEAAK
jgi:hypothetical protein